MLQNKVINTVIQDSEILRTLIRLFAIRLFVVNQVT